jgi:hypothetical protein
MTAFTEKDLWKYQIYLTDVSEVFIQQVPLSSLSVPSIHSFCSSASGESLNCLRESAVWEGEMVLRDGCYPYCMLPLSSSPSLLPSHTHRPIPLYTTSISNPYCNVFKKNFAYIVFFLVKGPAADANDAPQP